MLGTSRELICPSSWNQEGILLGKIVVDGGSANFAWVPNGMYIFNEYKLFKVTLRAQGRTVARDFGVPKQGGDGERGGDGWHHGHWSA